jgi:hypothetical protein
MNDLRELANNLQKLDDKTLQIILKDIDEKQLSELILLEDLHALIKIRIAIELTQRKEVIAPPTTQLPVIAIPLKVPRTAKGIIPLPNLILRSSLFSASKTHGAKAIPVKDLEITTYGQGEQQAKIYLTAYRQFTQLDLDLLFELVKLQQQNINSLLLKITIRGCTPEPQKFPRTGF